VIASQGYVPVEGGRLWYQRAGEGFPVVLVHPDLWDSRIWEDQFDELSHHHDVIQYDQRGAGRSDPPTGPYSGLRDLLYLLDELGVGRCALVGCASGAALAIDLALASPMIADALVLTAPDVSGRRWEDPGLPVLEAEIERAALSGDLDVVLGMQLAVWAPGGLDPGSDDRVLAVARDNVASVRAASTHREPPPPTIERLEEITAATLVVVGDRDLAERHAIAELLASRIPGASKRVIAEADQLVNVRKPTKFNRLLLDFLAFRS
jgi:pimeloyl-ACP methyl ester carboxylesterase